MKRLIGTLFVGVFACQILGCGGSKALPPAKTAPVVDVDKKQKELDRMYEMRKSKGPRPTVESTGPKKE